MQNKAYRLLTDRFDVPAGTLVFRSVRYDYGCANDDTRVTGVKHISVTRNPDGDYPFFSVPVTSLESTN